MKEMHEFRVFEDYYHLLPRPNNAKFNGMVYVLKISAEDALFQQVGRLYEELRRKHSQSFFSFWDVHRIYTKKELTGATLFHFHIKTAFEPTGEECGTVY
jgi:hypothetical protein